ncbi:MAG: class I SAM-dependent methyltransferase [Syntrophales bacterium]|nr:class I SAM-dependent methyltransferase [Syntrophales bacterium]
MTDIPFFDKIPAGRFLNAWENHSETPELDRIALSPTILSEDGHEIPLRSQVSIRYAHFLYHLVKLFRPDHILEIGMANGISSAFIASAHRIYAKEGQVSAHIIIDPFQSSDWKGAGRALLSRLQLDAHVDIMEDYSVHAISALEKQGRLFDFVFIDGNHSLDYTLADVLLSDLVLRIGGILTMDDSTDFGVKTAVPYLDKYRTNLTRIRFDGPTIHWIREFFNKRRRITVYQKTSRDDRGADGI